MEHNDQCGDHPATPGLARGYSLPWPKQRHADATVGSVTRCPKEPRCSCSGADRVRNWHGYVFETGRGNFRNYGATAKKTALNLACTECFAHWTARGFNSPAWRELGLPVDLGESAMWLAGIAFGRLYGRCGNCEGHGIRFINGDWRNGKEPCPYCNGGLVDFSQHLVRGPL